MSSNDPAADFVDFGTVAVDSLWLNSLILLIENSIADTGQIINKTDQTQTSRAMAHYAANGTFYTDSGTPNTYVLTPISTVATKFNRTPTEYLDGMEVVFTTPNANTGPATVNVNSLGSKPIVESDGTTVLIANDIPANRFIIIKFKKSDDAFRLLSVNGGGAGTMTRPIAQTAHGLAVGNVVRLNGSGDYVLAQADTITNAEVVGIISGVADANNFVLTVGGFITALSGLTTGVVMFLSPTVAGTLTSSNPTGQTQISKPVLIAEGATSGYFFNMRGLEVGDVDGKGRLQSVQVFTASGTWTRPAGITRVETELVGGGGSGGNGVAGATGGGGGGYSRLLITSGLGATETITIGAGATAVTSGNNGNTGGTTSFGAFLSATGGTGGFTTNGGGTGTGGTGTGGNFNIRGSSGGLSISSTLGGRGGGSQLGGSRNGAIGTNAGDGFIFGGGSGGANGGTGGAGADGIIIVREYT